MKFGLREIVFVALLVIVPVASWSLVFRPMNAEAADIREQIEAKQARLRELDRATATIGDLKSRIEKLEEAMVFFRSKLPNEKEIDKVLEEVWQLAERNRLATKSIRTLKRTQAQQLGPTGRSCSEQPIGVLLEGNFLGFYSFLQALENQPRIMRIQKMDLTKAARGPQGDMRAEFTMTIFFEGPE